MKANNSHDFSLVDASGTEVGLMCVRDKNGTPMYAKGTLALAGDQSYTSSPEYTSSIAEQSLIIGQTDFRGGAGLEYVGKPDTEKRYHYTINGDARFANEFRLGPKATTLATGAASYWAKFNDTIYVASGTNLYKVNSTGDGWTLISNIGTTITNLFASTVSDTDYLFICVGWSTAYRYMNAAETIVTATLKNNTLKHITKVNNTFYGSKTNSRVVATVNPINSGMDWRDIKQVGDDSNDITGLLPYEGLLYITKEDRPYYLNSNDPASSIVSILTDETAHLGNSATTGGRNSFIWHDSIYMPYGNQGLLEFDGRNLTWVSPALYMNGAGDFAGYVAAVTGDEEYLYIVLDDGTDIQIVAGRRESVDSVTGWRWHPLSTIALTNCASAFICDVYKKRMWIGSDTGTDSVYWIPITTKYGAIGSDTNYTYLTGGYLITPWIHCNLRGDKKAWIKITLTMGHTYDAGIYFEAHYKKLGDSSFTDIGDFQGTSGNMISTAYIPIDGSSYYPSSQMMQFKFVGITNDTAKTPILLSYEVQAIWYPPQKQIIYTTVQVEKGQTLKQEGTVETVANSAITTVLNELYNPATAYPRLMYPIDWVTGDTATYIKALPPQKSWVAKSDKGESLKWIYELALEVIPLTLEGEPSATGVTPYTYLLLSGGTMSGAIAMGTNKITGLGDPTAAQDADTKTSRDSAISTHAALATAVHGAGASILATIANIATHAALTATHGVAGTIAGLADIVTHAALVTGVHGLALGARVTNSANLAVANATETTLTFDTERWDTATIHSTVTGTDRLTATTAGRYSIIAQVIWAANATGDRLLNLYLNGSTNIANDCGPTVAVLNPSSRVETVYELAANDFVNVKAYQNSGGSLNVLKAANYSPEFMMERVG